MNVIVVINRSAGGIRIDSEPRMRQLMRSTGLTFEIVDFDRALADRQLRELAARRPDFLVVWGGDGTHRTALNTLGREPSNLILLPGGTRNLLARSLHGSTAWENILLAVIARPLQRVLPAGRIGDDLFFCAMLAGAPALFAEARESLRYGDFSRAMDEVGRGLAAAQSPHLAAGYSESPSAEFTRLPPTCLIGALVGFLAENKRMEVVALMETGMFPALDVVWSSFQEGFRNLEGVSITPADTLLVENEDGEAISAIADGERLAVGASFQARFLERGGYCLTAAS
jgi:hypothetical protein